MIRIEMCCIGDVYIERREDKRLYMWQDGHEETLLSAEEERAVMREIFDVG